jgi:hypothetical protein
MVADIWFLLEIEVEAPGHRFRIVQPVVKSMIPAPTIV